MLTVGVGNKADAAVTNTKIRMSSERPGPSMEDLLREEKTPVPANLRETRNDYAGGGPDIDKERYFSPEFARSEKENLWRRTWQMACRVEEIPAVGDSVLYEAPGLSLIVVRSSRGEIKAFHNACPHRGMMLRECDGHVSRFRCKFHGFMWSLSGELGHVPSAWDFPNIKANEFRLPEANVGVWGGFVFVNPDGNAISFEDYISDIPEHFKAWGCERRYKALHIGVLIRCNWKIGLEAFLENLHVPATHPEVISFNGYEAAQVDARKDRPHFSRHLVPNAVPAAFLRDRMDEQQIFDDMVSFNSGKPAPAALKVPPGKTAREHAAELRRQQMADATQGGDFSGVSTPELIDNLSYFIFPNLKLWGGYGVAARCDRFRPWEDDPELCLMETIFLPPAPAEGPAPPPAPMRLLEMGQTFADVPELGTIGPFLDQDVRNMAWVHKGLKIAAKSGVTTSNYQESQIRHFHRTLDMYLRGETVR